MPRQATWERKGLETFTELVNAEVNPVKYVAIDPGKFNGIAMYDEKFYLQALHVVNAADMVAFLNAFKKLDMVVCESYRIFAGKEMQHRYSDMETVRVIGRVESYCEMRDVKLVKQMSSIKPTGYAWIGKKPPRNKNDQDPMDAHVHMMYWAVMHKKVNAHDLLRKGSPE